MLCVAGLDVAVNVKLSCLTILSCTLLYYFNKNNRPKTRNQQPCVPKSSSCPMSLRLKNTDKQIFTYSHA